MKIQDDVLLRADNQDFDATGAFVVPEGVREIDGNAFMFSDKFLRSIVIPEGVEKIGSFCFYRCENLSDINLPRSLKKVGDLVFFDCKSLQGLEFPEGVEYIGKGVFTCCDNLETVIIPHSVRKIGSDTFYGCDELKNLAIPKRFENEIDDILGGYFVGRQKPQILFTESVQQTPKQIEEK